MCPFGLHSKSYTAICFAHVRKLCMHRKCAHAQAILVQTVIQSEATFGFKKNLIKFPNSACGNILYSKNKHCNLGDKVCWLEMKFGHLKSVEVTRLISSRRREFGDLTVW